MGHCESTLSACAMESLWRGAGLPEAALSHLELTGIDAVLPSSFAIGAAAQATIALAGLAAGELWHLRGNRRQKVAVDMRHAAVEFRSERYLTIDGKAPADLWNPLARLYRTRDGVVRLHTNFPHHRDGVLRLLQCDGNRDAVAAALGRWSAIEFEKVAASAGLCVAALRSFADWDAHPQGRATPVAPLVVEQIGEAAPEPLPSANRPLGGVRVLDLTRIIAGPVAGRALAAHGADVLLVTGPHLPSIPTLVIDTGRGKRAASLDLRQAQDGSRLESLVREADVFVQGYRPGALDARGFDRARLAELRPGLVYASLSAYGETGPWRGRRGFDSLVQTASGFNMAEAEAAGDDSPRALPGQALDHATGYLLAFGVMAALHRRACQGGTWRVAVSLAATGRWLRSLGRIENGFAAPDISPAQASAYLEDSDSDFGQLRSVRHAALLSDTPARWDQPARKLGEDKASWCLRRTSELDVQP